MKRLLLMLGALVLVSARQGQLAGTTPSEASSVVASTGSNSEPVKELQVRELIIQTALQHGVDCSNAGENFQGIVKDIQASLVRSGITLESRCLARERNASQIASDQTLWRYAELQQEKMRMQAAFNATMLPHLARLAEKTGSEAQKVKTAELANATAHETLAGDRLKLDEAMQAVKLRETELAREQDVSKSRYEKVVEDSKPVLKESVADAQQELAFLKTATAAAYANKTRRCTKVHEDAALATQRHKAIIDKVVPLVQALHDCKAKHTQTLPGATVFLETAGSGCSDIRSKLFAGFSQTPPSILLEVRRSGNLTLTMQILHKVEANLTVWRNEKKICDDKAEEARFSAEAKGAEVMKRAIEAASALASEKLGNATIERAAHNKIYSDRLDQAQKQLNLALVKLNGAPTTTGTPTKGSIRLALSKSSALRDQRAMQMLVIGSSKDDYLEEHAREEAAKNAQVALLEDTHKNDTDSTQRMLEVTISDIRQMCKVEHELISTQEKAIDTLEIAFLADVNKITTPTIVTTPKPDAKSELNHGDSAVSKYTFVKLTMGNWRENSADSICKSEDAKLNAVVVDSQIEENPTAICDAAKLLNVNNVGFIVAEMHLSDTSPTGGKIRLLKADTCSSKGIKANLNQAPDKYPIVLQTLAQYTDTFVVCVIRGVRE